MTDQEKMNMLQMQLENLSLKYQLTKMEIETLGKKMPKEAKQTAKEDKKSVTEGGVQ